jgi:hypothetical protein
VRVIGKFLALAGALLLAAPTAGASEREPRRLFVEAEMLRRAEVCDVGRVDPAGDPQKRALALPFIETQAKADQLQPLLPVLTGLPGLDDRQRSELIDCLTRWREAARIEQRILEEHPDSEVAFELARERRLTPSDIDKVIARVEDAHAEADAARGAAERARRAYEALSRPARASLTQSQLQALRQQIAGCWSPPSGAQDKDAQVEVRVRLARDGRLISAELMSRERMGEPFYRALAESVLRALRVCSPLEGLPSGRYAEWRSLRLTFDARELLGAGR